MCFLSTFWNILYQNNPKWLAERFDWTPKPMLTPTPMLTQARHIIFSPWCRHPLRLFLPLYSCWEPMSKPSRLWSSQPSSLPSAASCVFPTPQPSGSPYHSQTAVSPTPPAQWQLLSLPDSCSKHRLRLTHWGDLTCRSYQPTALCQ